MSIPVYLTHCRASFPQDGVEARSFLRAWKEIGPVNGKEIHKGGMKAQKYLSWEVVEMKVEGNWNF